MDIACRPLSTPDDFASRSFASHFFVLSAVTHPGRRLHAAKLTRQRNCVFILTDDERFDSLGCAGNRIIQTPNIDRLAANGVRFRNHFVTTSICCVSRASIFTGQYERRHGIGNFTAPLSPAQWTERKSRGEKDLARK